MRLFYIFPLLFLHANNVNCAKILGIFPFPGYSQFMLGEKLMGELAKRGHEVTVISEYEPNEKIKNYETVKLGKSGSYNESFDLMTWTETNYFTLTSEFLEMCVMYSEAGLKQKPVQELIHSNRKFDLVIVENFCNEAHMGFSEHFKAPLVVFTSQAISEWSSHLVGNVKLASITPELATPYTKQMVFFERLQNLALTIFDNLYKEFIYFPVQQRLLDKYFPNKMDLKKVFTSTEILLTFSHPLTTEPSLTTSAVVEVGGLHIDVKKLPDDIQSFLDDAKNGAIIISLGSNLPCSVLTKKQLDIFLNVFRKLPQRILWKCELQVPNKPDNLFLSKWLPQSDILAHPNTIAFVTHSGLLSTTEAIYHAVPMISIPVFGDQPMNAARAVKNGIAEKLNLLDMSETELYEAISKVTKNPEYKTRIQKMSKMFRDQPSKPLERAIHAVEYVLKYKPGEFLRSPSLDLWWFQLYSLDVFLFIFTLFVLAYVLLLIIIRKLVFKKKLNKKKTA